ncbi:MAG: CRTAC1 family protein [Acidobacteria bacterium]|nr:MAG: CRTAC1 family protein [Acidobacteriota bacterium]REK08336.1 MAG: CRTAC1 family protein [Acidobacteriota bacterium]
MLERPCSTPAASRAVRRTVASLALAIALAPPTAGARQASETDDLRAACAQLTAADNPFFGRAALERLDLRLDELSPSPPVHLLVERAGERLRLGELSGAIDDLDAALSALSAQRSPDGDSVSDRDLLQRAHWLAGIAALQLGEDSNCLHGGSGSPGDSGRAVAQHPDACIVPLRPGALHREPRWAVRAAMHLRQTLALQPGDPLAVWLLNLATALQGGDSDALPRALQLPGLVETGPVSPRRWRGIDYATLGASARDDLAGGAVVDDFDGDGLLDLVTSTWDPCLGVLALRNRGDGSFEDVSAPWRLADQFGGLNLVQTDYDDDGVLDLLVLRGAWLLGDGAIRNSLLRGVVGGDGAAGSGDFHFLDVTAEVGLAEPARPTQTAAWADVDGDGDLDLFVGNEATAAHPHPSQLFLNQSADASSSQTRGGARRFVDVAPDAGVENLRYAKGVAFGDYDDDGDADLYVSNFGPNRLYRNDGPDPEVPGGPPRFVDVAPELGVTEPALQSFATWWFDFDDDGDLDLFVADYRSQARAIAASYRGERVRASDGQPLLYRNLLRETGTPGFREVSRELGLVRPSMPMGANHADLDNDGWLDLVLGTGEPDLASVLPNQVWSNRGPELGFEETTFETGLGHLQKGHGIAFGDVDHDGDRDLLHQLGGFYPVDRFPNLLFENPTLSSGRPAAPDRRWITLELEGRRANRAAIGARVKLVLRTATGSRELHRVVGSGGSFGASTLRLEVGLGGAEAIERIEIVWPGSGLRQVVTGAPLDRFVRVVEGIEGFETIDRPPIVLPRASSGEEAR